MDQVIRRRSNISTAIIILCLLFLLMPIIPCFSKAEREGVDIKDKDPTGIYDIDYRGPETHSYVPPPSKAHSLHHQHHDHDHDHGRRVMVLPRRYQGLKVKKVHG